MTANKLTNNKTNKMAKKNQEVAVLDERMLAELKDAFPIETGGFTRIQLPRIAYDAQDVMEGEGKNKKVVLEAGTFSLNKETGETDKEGKKVWGKEEIGKEIAGIILYYRYQLSLYDEDTELYTSSSVFDSQDEIVPLWSDKKQIAKGTPAELRALYQFVDSKDGKTKSKLKDNRILYILYKGELHQLDLHGSSMYSFMKYAKSVTPPAVLTRFSSESQTKGKIEWNMMTFSVARSVTPEELQDNLEKVKEIKMAIGMEKGIQNQTAERYIKQAEDEDKLNKEFEKM